jgi:hypothetical protein
MAVRRKIFLGLLSAILLLLCGTFTYLNFRDGLQTTVLGTNSSGSVTTTVAPRSGVAITHSPTSQSTTPAQLHLQPTTLLEELRFFILTHGRRNWRLWLMMFLAVVAAVTVVVVLAVSMPADLFKVVEVKPDDAKPVLMDDISVTASFYQQPWFIALVSYAGLSVLFLLVDFALFRSSSFTVFDGSDNRTKILSFLVSLPVHLLLMPAYVVCCLVVGLLVKVQVALLVTSDKKAVKITRFVGSLFLQILFLPFALLLSLLELLRMVFVSVFSMATRCCQKLKIEKGWTDLGEFIKASLIFSKCSVVGSFHDGYAGAAIYDADKILQNQPLLSKLSFLKRQNQQ